jgi:glutathione S-transferase
MKLHTTPTSPYGRIARIVLIEKGLEDRIPVIPAQTRKPDSPYYKINASGRVPCLELDDGTGLEESALVSAYLDQLDGESMFTTPDGKSGWEARRLEAMARSMLDGISLWGREFLYRDENERSATIIAHEEARANRLADAFEREADHPALTGQLNMAQITLACTFDGRENKPEGFDWRAGRPKLAALIDRLGERPSIASTRP